MGRVNDRSPRFRIRAIPAGLDWDIGVPKRDKRRSARNSVRKRTSLMPDTVPAAPRGRAHFSTAIEQSPNSRRPRFYMRAERPPTSTILLSAVGTASAL